MHIAAALKSQLLSVHTWTDPRRVGPFNPDALIWKNGVILRVRDLANLDPQKKGRAFNTKDLPPLIAWLRESKDLLITTPSQGDQGTVGPIPNPVGR